MPTDFQKNAFANNTGTLTNSMTDLAPFHIFKSIECDILNDGRLDYTDQILSTFDLVIASVHSNLKMTEEKAMRRLLGAIQNPHTRILGPSYRKTIC